MEIWQYGCMKIWAYESISARRCECMGKTYIFSKYREAFQNCIS